MKPKLGSNLFIKKSLKSKLIFQQPNGLDYEINAPKTSSTFFFTMEDLFLLMSSQIKDILIDPKTMLILAQSFFQNLYSCDTNVKGNILARDQIIASKVLPRGCCFTLAQMTCSPHCAPYRTGKNMSIGAPQVTLRHN